MCSGVYSVRPLFVPVVSELFECVCRQRLRLASDQLSLGSHLQRKFLGLSLGDQTFTFLFAEFYRFTFADSLAGFLTRSL